jgi:hypothetical protein
MFGLFIDADQYYISCALTSLYNTLRSHDVTESTRDLVKDTSEDIKLLSQCPIPDERTSVSTTHVPLSHITSRVLILFYIEIIHSVKGN